MKESLKHVEDTDKGWGEISYFQNNVERMKYDEYADKSFPIGSGLVEGSCKFVIGKRFKGSGMRWKRQDNQRVLRTRLAKLNRTLPDFFAPKPREWTIPAAAT